MILTKDKDKSSLNESKYFTVQCSGLVMLLMLQTGLL